MTPKAEKPDIRNSSCIHNTLDIPLEGGDLSCKFFIYVGSLNSSEPLREIIEDLPKPKPRPRAICRKDPEIIVTATAGPALTNA